MKKVIRKWVREQYEMLTNPIVLAFLIFVFVMTYINCR